VRHLLGFAGSVSLCEVKNLNLQWPVALLAGLTSATPAIAQTGKTFEVKPLSEGVYAALVVPRPPTYTFANALIVVHADGVLVVDTHQTPTAAEALLAEVRKITERPVRTVVNTHWHGDHVWGNQVYADAYPGVEFIGHETLRDDMLTRGRADREEALKTLPASIEQRRGWLSTGRGPDEKPLTEKEREDVRYSLSARETYLADLKRLRLVPPDTTFSRRLVLHRGGREIHLLHFGPAHTRGDVVVHLPKEKIAAVGDLLEDVFPYTAHSYPAGWAQALEGIAELKAARLLPSHGGVQEDGKLLDVELRLFKALAEQARQALRNGWTLEETRARVRLEAFREFFTHGDAGRDAAYDRSVATALERAYLEAREALKPGALGAGPQ